MVKPVVIDSSWSFISEDNGGGGAGGDVEGTTTYASGTTNFVDIGRFTTLQTDLLTYYDFNSNFNDSSGNNHNATASGASIDTVDKKLGAGSLDLTTSGDYVNIPNPVQINTGDFSVAFWVKFDNVDIYPTILFSTNTNAIANNRFAIFLNNSGGRKIQFSCKTTTANNAYTNTTVTTGVWYHVAFTRTGGTGRIYVNGSFEKTGGAKAGDMGTTSDWRIGTATTRDNPQCRIDEFAFYTRVLTDDEVSQLYNSGVGRDPTGGTSTNQYVAQKITPTYDVIRNVSAYIDRVGNPNSVILKLQKDNAGVPDGVTLASIEANPVSLPANVSFDFDDDVNIIRDDTYHLVWEAQNGDTNNYYKIASNTSQEAGEDFSSFDGTTWTPTAGQSLAMAVDQTTVTEGPATWTFLDCSKYDRIINGGNLASVSYDSLTNRNTVVINRADVTDRTYPSQGAVCVFFNTGMTAQDLYTSKFRIRVYNHDDIKSTYAFLTVGLASETDGTRFGTMGLDYQLANQRNKRIQHNGSSNSSSVGNQQGTGRGCLVHLINNNGTTYGNVVLDTFATSVDANGDANTSSQYNVSPSAITAVNGGDGIYLMVLFGHGNVSNPALTQITYDFTIEKSPFIKL